MGPSIRVRSPNLISHLEQRAGHCPRFTASSAQDFAPICTHGCQHRALRCTAANRHGTGHRRAADTVHSRRQRAQASPGGHHVQAHALHAVLCPPVLLRHPDVSPGTPLHAHGRRPRSAQLVRHEIQVAVGGAIVQLPRRAQQSSYGGEHFHRLKISI